MELPADTPPGVRRMWACLAAIVGIIHDGPDNDRSYHRLKAACQTFGVPEEEFDACARRTGIYYYRPWDAYLDRETYLDVTLRESVPLGGIH